ncbi:uncharacterized protein C20orf204 homolog isoform X2 [Nomascus leucogenys]|uniref:uncharacterized protein C20orf204 homolog isoform X2 n=3 Tax=Hylobatidae TaxID=9577 RepID=UPI00122DBC94|nr:uncharacterized protein C20orf204 homolog isoform X2 [Nomascus leucogenys]
MWVWVPLSCGSGDLEDMVNPGQGTCHPRVGSGTAGWSLLGRQPGVQLKLLESGSLSSCPVLRSSCRSFMSVFTKTYGGVSFDLSWRDGSMREPSKFILKMKRVLRLFGVCKVSPALYRCGNRGLGRKHFSDFRAEHGQCLPARMSCASEVALILRCLFTTACQAANQSACPRPQQKRQQPRIGGAHPAPSLEEPTSKASAWPAPLQSSRQPVQGSGWLVLDLVRQCTPHPRTPGSCVWPAGGSEGGQDPERPMVPPKPALWALLLALLGTAPSRAYSPACSVPDVLRHYRAIIFEDLQAAVKWGGAGAEKTRPGSRHFHFIQKNLTRPGSSGRRGRPRASCGAQKEHSILLSISSLGRTLRGAVAGGRRGALERAAWTVAVRTEAVMRRHCRTLRQRSRRPKMRPARRRGGRRQLLLRALDAVATCWEKLFALRAPASRGS